MKINKLIVISSVFLMGIGIVTNVITGKLAINYVHWHTKSGGYPEIYEKKEYYKFEPVPGELTADKGWKEIGIDTENDGDIRNWADVKSLSVLKKDGIYWFRFSLYNNIDLNEPMVSIAVEADNAETAKSWYGTQSAFRYDEMIVAGYVRDGERYSGYNFAGKNKGVNVLSYDLKSNSLYLGVPLKEIGRFSGRKFVASVGNKGLWNDDVDTVLTIDID